MTADRQSIPDATIAAIVASWSSLHALLPNDQSDVRRRLSDAATAGLHLIVVGPAVDDEPTCRRVAGASADGQTWTASANIAYTDALDVLAPFGIGPGLVAAVGLAAAEWPGLRAHLPANRLLDLVDDQMRRRRSGRVATIDVDPEWVIAIDNESDSPRHRIIESVLTVGAGGVGTRGATEEDDPRSIPLTVLAGVYADQGDAESLLAAPDWTRLDLDPPPVRSTRLLDMRTGVLLREETGARGLPLRTLRFVCVRRPGVAVLSAEASRRRLHTTPPLTPDPQVLAPKRWTATVASDHGGGIDAAVDQRVHIDGGLRTVERIAAFAGDDDKPPDIRGVTSAVRAARSAGVDALLREQRQAWAQRWHSVDIRIPDDPQAQQALRYALFELWSNVDRQDELAVGARGLSGTGYLGHVFWDADIFVAPAMAAVEPATARAMVQYRIHRLDAARRRASAEGRRGARFPWESASTGADVTPHNGRLGDLVTTIRTGSEEEHITADVAWSAVRCAQWAGRDWGPTSGVTRLLFETARYWASRARIDADGAHIDEVIGPDEYHAGVDDNVFTNAMARWNLRHAAAAARALDVAHVEAASWEELAERLIDGYHPERGIHEQFCGYFGLEPLRVADYATTPVAIDLLLGPDRVAKSQLIKQPDVLMAHYLLPDDMHPGTLAADLDFYEPRTAHGSSLSPSITAALYARVGRPDDGLALLRRALRLDLDDVSGMTAAGLHVANLGGLWQAVLGDFAGVTVRDGVLTVAPSLPAAWPRLAIRFRALGAHVRLRLDHGAIELEADRPVRVRIGTRAVEETTHLRSSAGELT